MKIFVCFLSVLFNDFENKKNIVGYFAGTINTRLMLLRYSVVELCIFVFRLKLVGSIQSNIDFYNNSTNKVVYDSVR